MSSTVRLTVDQPGPLMNAFFKTSQGQYSMAAAVLWSDPAERVDSAVPAAAPAFASEASRFNGIDCGRIL